MIVRHSKRKKKNHIEVMMSGPNITKATEKEIKKALCRIRRLLGKEISFWIAINPENTHPEEE